MLKTRVRVEIKFEFEYSASLVKILIDECPTLNLNLGNKNGQTPLHLAANYRSLEVSLFIVSIFI
jgi:ankyrin repeat protein